MSHYLLLAPFTARLLAIYLLSFFSGLFLVERDFQSLLGNVRRHENGDVYFASAAEFKLIGMMNGTAARLHDIEIDNALGEYVSSKDLG
jgi:hypothetical protein